MARLSVNRPGVRVLLAEDDSDLRELIAHVLRADGLEVVEVESGTQLLALLGTAPASAERDGPAELVVSDLRMPGLTGLGVLQRLKETGRHVPFILITAFGDAETHAAARRLGATAVLDKPFELGLLCGLVRACFAAN
jgi:CheY-like chemotaxis protein